jgi:hypothetical protein
VTARRAVVAGTALAGTMLLCGCSTKIDGAKGERLIRRTVSQQVGAQVRSVRCPRDLVAKAGATFHCTVTAADGSSGRAVVIERDDKGRVTVDAPFLHVREVQKAIASRLSGQVGRRVRVRCPQIVTVAKGGRFTCRARGRKIRARIRVVQQDAHGRIRYAVAR